MYVAQTGQAIATNRPASRNHPEKVHQHATHKKANNAPQLNINASFTSSSIYLRLHTKADTASETAGVAGW